MTVAVRGSTRGSADFAIAGLAGAQPSEAVAVLDGDRRCTYGQLDAASGEVAATFRALGIARGDHVTFVGRNGLPCVEVLLGAAKVGAVVTMANWRLHPDELAYVLDDSAAKVVVVTEEFADHLPEPDPASMRQVVVADGPGATLRSGPAGQVEAGRVEAAPVRPDDVVAQLYTSGTTGRPKGAVLTHRGFAAAIPDIAAAWQLDETSVVLSVLPMFHIAGIGTVLGALHCGAVLVIDNDARPAATVADIERYGVTNLVIASSMLQALVASPECATADLSTLRTVSYGAAPITQQVLRDAARLFGCRLMQPYGLTETTGVLTLLDADDHAAAATDPVAAERLASCGRARPGVELRVVDPATGTPVGAGAVGEVWARSERVMQGYWNRPEATAEALDGDGWFRTGDLGHLDGDGYLFLHDRLTDMIVSGGENIYPAEVEEVLQQHAAVSEAAVIGVPDERWGETPKAVVVLTRDGEASGVSGDELIAFARDRMAHYKCPTSVEVVAELPRNPTGKVLRRSLRDRYWGDRPRRIN